MKRILTRREQALIAFVLALLVVGGIVKIVRVSYLKHSISEAHKL
jgi:hypothetical protein